ncbi:MAG: glucosamine-6-phosphate deaminase [Cyanobacteria bacterium SZAS-4]|nr:glucosamine-6-phosphate deaminase [Cyanobacteria bacterium SZAS-4]
MHKENTVIVEKYEALSEEIADVVAAQISSKPNSCFGLPTGNSPLGCYKFLGDWSKQKKIDWSQTKCFALDEYVDADESITFQHFLQTNLYQYTNLQDQNKFNPSACDDYDTLIESQGGLDLTILGLGANGHIAFNEPGTPLESYTHSIWLTESTRKANQSYFTATTTVPYRAVTMGIRTILNSRKLILIASGAHKKDILEQALLGAVDPNIPASYLSLHPHVTVLTDFEF